MTDTVTRKALMQPFKPNGGLSFMTVISLLVGLGVLYLLSQGLGALALLPAAIILVPCFIVSEVVKQVTHLSKEKKLMKSITADARKVMIDYIGKEPKYIDTQGCASRSHARCAVGTGIAFDGQNIYVLDDGEIGKIPWKLVRSWKWSIKGYDSVKVYSAGAPVAAQLSAQLEANADNARSSLNAKMASGFFVSVADVEKPDWQFTCWDKATLKKWYEIFTQINEGRLQAA